MRLLPRLIGKGEGRNSRTDVQSPQGLPACTVRSEQGHCLPLDLIALGSWSSYRISTEAATGIATFRGWKFTLPPAG